MFENDYCHMILPFLYLPFPFNHLRFVFDSVYLYSLVIIVLQTNLLLVDCIITPLMRLNILITLYCAIEFQLIKQHSTSTI